MQCALQLPSVVTPIDLTGCSHATQEHKSSNMSKDRALLAASTRSQALIKLRAASNQLVNISATGSVLTPAKAVSAIVVVVLCSRVTCGGSVLQDPAIHKDAHKESCVEVSFSSGTDLGFDKNADTPYVKTRSGRSADLS